MTADLLRRAAHDMRAKAEASPEDSVGPARVDIDREGTCDACAENKHLVASYPEPDNEPWLCAECAGYSDFMASWHPVALAVADWLDRAAQDHDSESCYTAEPPDGCYAAHCALAVARTYLNEQP